MELFLLITSIFLYTLGYKLEFNEIENVDKETKERTVVSIYLYSFVTGVYVFFIPDAFLIIKIIDAIFLFPTAIFAMTSIHLFWFKK